jgi:hypothetical protein
VQKLVPIEFDCSRYGETAPGVGLKKNLAQLQPTGRREQAEKGTAVIHRDVETLQRPPNGSIPMGREIKDRGKIDSQVAIERSRSPSGAVSVGNGRGIYRIRARWDDAGEPLRVLLRPAGEKDVNIGRAETLLCREVKENVLSFSQLRVKFETPGRAPLLHNCANADEVCKCCR